MTEQIKFNPDLSIILIGSIINKSLSKYTGDFPDCKAIIPIDSFLTDLNDLAIQYTTTFQDIRFPKIDIKLLSFIISKTLFHRFVQIGQKEVVIDVVPHIYENMLKNIVATSTLRYSKYLWRYAKDMYEKEGKEVSEETKEVETKESEVEEKEEVKVDEDNMEVDKEDEEEVEEDKEVPSESVSVEVEEEKEEVQDKEEAEKEENIVAEEEEEQEEEPEEEVEQEQEEEEESSDKDATRVISESPDVEEKAEVVESEKEDKEEEEIAEPEEQEVEESEGSEEPEEPETKSETPDVEDEVEEEVEEETKEKHVTIADDAKDEQSEDSDSEEESKEASVESDHPTKTRKRSRSPSTQGQYKRFQNIAVKLMNTIQEHRFSSPFLQAVNKRDAPDYYEVIYEPKDLKSILKTVKSKKEPEYHSIKQLERDIMLMFANCIMYNKSDDDLVQLTISMKEEVRNIFKIFEEAEEDMK
ncbi:Bromodomain-containing protein 8 [Spathaspora sp. JA1]|nr:Bromodomain-containing protein 8 [Spathaspora sp. JA1]